MSQRLRTPSAKPPVAPAAGGKQARRGGRVHEWAEGVGGRQGKKVEGGWAVTS